MKLDILIDGETATVREASGTPNEIMSMACCILDSVAETLSDETDCPVSKAALLQLMGQSVIALSAIHSPRESAAADSFKNLEVRL